MVSFIDRMVINLLVEPIKVDLELSDTQMSLLIGLSFAVFYTLMGIPIARLADRYNRKLVIAIGIGLWSVMTALCGLARSFWTLFMARMGVGVGEAALSPAAYSMLADYFPPNKVGRAISVYSMGIFLGIGLAYVGGGALISLFGEYESIAVPVLGVLQSWQVIFVIVSLPGFLVVVAVLVIREPPRRNIQLCGDATTGDATTKGLNSSGFIAYLRLRRSVVTAHLMGFSLLSIASYGGLSWMPTYLIRVRQFSVESSGVYIGAIYMVFGMLGSFSGGWLSERIFDRGRKDAIFLVSSLTAFALVPTVLAVSILPGYWVLAGLAIFSLFISMPWGIAGAALQLIAPNRHRAQLSAVYLFAMTVVGLGVGPTLIAVLTDYVFRDEMDIGYSIAIASSLASIVAGITLWRGLPFYREAVIDNEQSAEPN